VHHLASEVDNGLRSKRDAVASIDRCITGWTATAARKGGARLVVI
jgi:hypothetical protein